MGRPFFSLIVPCHNTGDKIKRLFSSLERQNISKDDLEIIIVDDDSSDNLYFTYIKEYDFNVKYAYTDTKVHCPGNTRREGMKHITGRWLCFCDHDDFFDDGVLGMIKDLVDHGMKTPLAFCTSISSYDYENKKITKNLKYKQGWLHGKFYNVDDFIIPYNINFKEDLITHEDIYFNSLVLAVMYRIGRDFVYLDFNTYMWVEQKDSITRQTRNDRGYLWENFNDYIVAATDPYWGYASETGNEVYVNQILMTLLHCYFYYEAASYYEGPYKYRDILHDIKDLLSEIVSKLRMTTDDIINIIYANPMKYKIVKEECELATDLFIPKTSFKDFVNYLKGM